MIGIHKQSNNRLSEKDGDLIYHIFNLIKKDIEKIKKLKEFLIKEIKKLEINRKIPIKKMLYF